MWSRIMAIAAATFLAACGGDESDGKSTVTVRCLFVDDFCDQLTASMTSSQQSALGSACTAGGGNFAVGNCPLEGAVAGHCHYTGAVVAEITGMSLSGATMDEYYYTAGDWSPSSAQAYCELPPAGTWVP